MKNKINRRNNFYKEKCFTGGWLNNTHLNPHSFIYVSIYAYTHTYIGMHIHTTTYT